MSEIINQKCLRQEEIGQVEQPRKFVKLDERDKRVDAIAKQELDRQDHVYNPKLFGIKTSFDKPVNLSDIPSEIGEKMVDQETLDEIHDIQIDTLQEEIDRYSVLLEEELAKGEEQDYEKVKEILRYILIMLFRRDKRFEDQYTLSTGRIIKLQVDKVKGEYLASGCVQLALSVVIGAATGVGGVAAQSNHAFFVTAKFIGLVGSKGPDVAGTIYQGNIVVLQFEKDELQRFQQSALNTSQNVQGDIRSARQAMMEEIRQQNSVKSQIISVR